MDTNTIEIRTFLEFANGFRQCLANWFIHIRRHSHDYYYYVHYLNLCDLCGVDALVWGSHFSWLYIAGSSVNRRWWFFLPAFIRISYECGEMFYENISCGAQRSQTKKWIRKIKMNESREYSTTLLNDVFGFGLRFLYSFLCFCFLFFLFVQFGMILPPLNIAL